METRKGYFVRHVHGGCECIHDGLTQCPASMDTLIYSLDELVQIKRELPCMWMCNIKPVESMAGSVKKGD